jgi:hypothetical protein
VECNNSTPSNVEVRNAFTYRPTYVVLGAVMVVALDTGYKVLGFKPGRERWIFKGDKNVYHEFLRRGRKVIDLMS